MTTWSIYDITLLFCSFMWKAECLRAKVYFWWFPILFRCCRLFVV